MSQVERSSNKIVSALRKQPAFDGFIVHRSDQGVIHTQKKKDPRHKIELAVQFFRGTQKHNNKNKMEQGILEKGEIEDLNKVYEDVKNTLKIKKVTDLQAKNMIFTNEEDESIEGSLPLVNAMNAQKIKELYFKKRGEKKLKKLNQNIYNTDKYGGSAPTTPSLFQSKLGLNNMIISFVKNKNRMEFESSHQEYRTEINRSFYDANFARAGNSIRYNSAQVTNREADQSAIYQRQNIISLETGLPFKKKIELRDQLFNPNRKEVTTGVRRVKGKSYSINANGENRQFTPNGSSIVSSLNDYFKLMSDVQTKNNSSQIKNNEGEPQKKPLQAEKYKQLKLKVEKNEESLINCCETFFHSKKTQNDLFTQLIDTASRDRPLTQQIRLRLYTARQSERQRLGQLRKSAERERKLILTNNNKQHEIYEQLLEQISRVRNENESLESCNYIFDTIKNILEDGNIMTRVHLFQIIEQIDQDENMAVNNLSMFLTKRLMDIFQIPVSELNKFSKFKHYIEKLLVEKIEPELQQSHH